MMVVLPAAIAYGLVIYSAFGPHYAAQGAFAGILGVVALGLVAPLFGGLPRLITAPCGESAVVLAALAALLLHADSSATARSLQPEQITVLMALVALLTGVLQFAFGAIGAGRLIEYIPYPVVAGYMSSVGVLIFLNQLPRLFGLPQGTGLWTGLASHTLWKWPSLVVGTVTVALMLAAPKVTRGVPAPILGLAGGILAYFGLCAWYPELLTLTNNPLVIGPISETAGETLVGATDHWAAIGWLGFGDLHLILMPSVTLAVLLSIHTLKTCVVVDALTQSHHDSNRELVGQGLGNFASGVLGGLPGAGVMGATLININSGGTTRLSAILAGLFALAVFLLLGGFMAWIPIATLAGILVVVAFRVVDWNVLHLLKQKSTIFDFAVVAAVVVTAVTVNLMAAAGAGLGLAILLFLREQIRGTVVRRKTSGNQTFSKKQRLPEELEVLKQKGAQTTIYELQGSLFFGTTGQLLSALEADLKTKTYVILDMRRVQSVDFTATHLLDQIEARLAERRGTLIFTHLPPNLPTGQDLQIYFDQVGLVKPTRHVRIFDELGDALEWTEDRILQEEGLLQTGQELPLGLHEIDLLKGFDEDILQALRACVTAQSFEAGQQIFKQGDMGDELFLIRRGTVRIVLPLAGGKQHHLASFGRGDFFGDIAFLDRGARTADAVASTATDLYFISRARLDTVAMEYPALDKKLFWRLARGLATRLRQTNAELRALEES